MLRSAVARLQRREHEGVGILHDAEAEVRGVLVAFANRQGGVSQPPYDQLNLAAESGDRRADVTENRRRVAAIAGFDPAAMVLSQPVHGTNVATVLRSGRYEDVHADGLMTSAPGRVLSLLTADCAAVVLASDTAVAILHGGWRGLAGGIVESGVASVGPVWRAWVGPAIRECCYEVGDDVLDAFRARGLPTGVRRVDLPSAAEAALRAAGVEQVVVADTCTGCDPDYFSYRREHLTGRQGAFVSILRGPGTASSVSTAPNAKAVLEPRL